jgi:Flp pilus assembly protein TadD
MLAVAWLNAEAYDRAAALLADDPGRATSPPLQAAYALALARSGKPAEAAEVFDRLLAEHSGWAALHVFVGQAKASQGDFPAAVASLNRALELDAAVPEAHGALGEIHLRQGRLKEAEDALRKELAVRPGDVRTRFHLAMTLDLENEAAAAIQELQLVLRADPARSDARYLLGKVLLAEGRLEESVSQLESAVALAPGEPNPHYQLALAYQRLGRVAEARGEFDVHRRLKQEKREATP